MGNERRAILLAGLAYGDEGKGKIVAYLSQTKNVHTIVRYCGSDQAAHNVVTDDNRHHTFSQFGSGSFTPGVNTHLARGMVVNPLSFMPEGQHLQNLGVTDIFKRVTVDRDALVKTPFQIAMNRLRELSRGQHRHGSCGLGVFETVQDHIEHGDRVMFVRDLENPQTMQRKLRFLQDLKREQAKNLANIPCDNEQVNQMLDILNSPDEITRCAEWFTRFIRLVTSVDYTYLAKVLRRTGVTIFEGAQGVLLDQTHGFFPHCTPTNTTFKNADRLLIEANYTGDITLLGVLRSYFTRHGAGPFVTQTDSHSNFVEAHNQEHPWQQNFRTGDLDLVALRYALKALGGVEEIALTHLDKIQSTSAINACSAYATPNTPDNDLFEVQDLHITDIKVATTPSLERQTRITQQLLSAKPKLEPLPTDLESFINYVESALHLPVTLCSTGQQTASTFERPILRPTGQARPEICASPSAAEVLT